jgi:2,3-bisphosphoglycerate-dependent phosphoglycerate mutase
LFPNLIPKYEISLREREKEIESHESLVKRVHKWYDQNEEYILSKTTAIFSHCGPINMILEYLDPEKTIFAYPYTCQFGCHTPLGSIWEISIIPINALGKNIK